MGGILQNQYANPPNLLIKDVGVTLEISTKNKVLGCTFRVSSGLTTTKHNRFPVSIGLTKNKHTLNINSVIPSQQILMLDEIGKVMGSPS